MIAIHVIVSMGLQNVPDARRGRKEIKTQKITCERKAEGNVQWNEPIWMMRPSWRLLSRFYHPPDGGLF